MDSRRDGRRRREGISTRAEQMSEIGERPSVARGTGKSTITDGARSPAGDTSPRVPATPSSRQQPPPYPPPQAGEGREGGHGRPPFECIALVLQGGGALGAYQGGVYQALAEAGLHPDMVAGISIGAINSAIIAGNPPERRVERLRSFWEQVSEPPLGIPTAPVKLNELAHRLVNEARATNILLFGAPNFFVPRLPSPIMVSHASPDTLSFYDVAPVRATLKQIVDFDLINKSPMRLSVGTVNIRTGNFRYFDTTTHRIGLDCILASAALPPGFPAVEIGGEYFWDGGLVSNTPLDWVLESPERRNTLTFQVDLWNKDGHLPRDLMEVELRQKEIRYSSRTRLSTDRFCKAQRLRRAMRQLIDDLPPELRQTPHAQALAAEADDKVYNIIHLIYHAKNYEGSSKDYEFSRLTMEEHWAAGYSDMVRTLRHPEVLQRPTHPDGVFVFDVARDGRF
jgi:NTE family protein